MQTSSKAVYMFANKWKYNETCLYLWQWSFVVNLNRTSTIGTQTSFLVGWPHCSGFHANINYVQKFASHNIISINLTSIDTTGNDNCFPGACWSL